MNYLFGIRNVEALKIDENIAKSLQNSNNYNGFITEMNKLNDKDRVTLISLLAHKRKLSSIVKDFKDHFIRNNPKKQNPIYIMITLV